MPGCAGSYHGGFVFTINASFSIIENTGQDVTSSKVFGICPGTKLHSQSVSNKRPVKSYCRSCQSYKSKELPIDLNDQFKHALDLMENTSKSVFITGRAGTGKSTLLSYFRHTTRKKVVVLAPTGVAALNVQGQTIHSFFRFKPNITMEQVKENSF